MQQTFPRAAYGDTCADFEDVVAVVALYLVGLQLVEEQRQELAIAAVGDRGTSCLAL